jgi:hypothetical protein
MAEEEVNWENATKSGNFVSLKEDEEKTLTLTNWRLEEVEKFGKETIEFVADVLKEDGEDVEKKFTTSSLRLKKKLRPVFEKHQPSEIVTISILRVGDKFDTQYSVKEK